MNKRVFAAYNGSPKERSLPDVCRDLYARQVEVWPDLRLAQEALQTARRREIPDGGFSYTLQYNPGRLGSVEARVDAASIAKRPCFLCENHLPAEQQAVLYRRSYVVLCNPFPIFIPHFTIAHREHLPQSIGSNIGMFLDLARDFSPAFSVFYNGPRCGASAPDHLHFQGCPSGAIPIEREGRKEAGALIKAFRGVSVGACCRGSRPFLLLESGDSEDLASVLSGVMQILKHLTGDGEEAMVNIIASFAEGRWRVFVFPRRKHRPDAFFRTGDDRRAITPGAVEMGGLIIATSERDYAMLNKQELTDIFTEVSAGGKIIQGVVDELLHQDG